MISRAGIVFAAIFFLYSAYFIVLKINGQWQAPIFIYIATFPFSILTNGLADYFQELWGWSDKLRSDIECGMAVILGVFEFYVIGLLLGKIFGRKDK